MSQKYLVIVINHSYAGFFAYVNFAINQIIYAEMNDLVPVVYFGPRSGDGRNAFHDAGRGDNTWSYYFEPVAGLTYDELAAKLADPDDPVTHDDIVTLTTEQLWDIHCRTPQSIYPYPHNMHRKHFKGDPAWYDEQRGRARRVMQDYIRVKPHIQKKVDAFADRYFGEGDVLGIHLRGTDKGTAGGVPVSLMRIVPPRSYFRYVNAYLKDHPDARIFVASDQQQFIDVFSRQYGDRVISRDALRGRGRENPFDQEDGEGYRKGEEVLIDCLLLSRCAYLLKCTSAVGEFAMYFNPGLECTDLNLVTRPIPFLDKFRVRRTRKWFKRREQSRRQEKQQEDR